MCPSHHTCALRRGVNGSVTLSHYAQPALDYAIIRARCQDSFPPGSRNDGAPAAANRTGARELLVLRGNARSPPNCFLSPTTETYRPSSPPSCQTATAYGRGGKSPAAAHGSIIYGSSLCRWPLLPKRTTQLPSGTKATYLISEPSSRSSVRASSSADESPQIAWRFPPYGTAQCRSGVNADGFDVRGVG